MDQPDLGLPGREYFINLADEKYRQAYLTLMLTVCELLGAQPDIAMRDMVQVLSFEKELSKVSELIHYLFILIICNYIKFYLNNP